jgi:hypothetical protein
MTPYSFIEIPFISVLNISLATPYSLHVDSLYRETRNISLYLEHGNNRMNSVKHAMRFYNSFKHVDCHRIEMMNMQSTI